LIPENLDPLEHLADLKVTHLELLETLVVLKNLEVLQDLVHQFVLFLEHLEVLLGHLEHLPVLEHL
jgi:hypothetical protein